MCSAIVFLLFFNSSRSGSNSNTTTTTDSEQPIASNLNSITEAPRGLEVFLESIKLQHLLPILSDARLSFLRLLCSAVADRSTVLSHNLRNQVTCSLLLCIITVLLTLCRYQIKTLMFLLARSRPGQTLRCFPLRIAILRPRHTTHGDIKESSPTFPVSFFA